MADLLIRLKRNADGSATLKCLRADGSATWQRHRRSDTGVMPSHDLTRYAVETVLGYARAFYGLIGEGWDITDFAPPFRRGPIPPEAREAEELAGAVAADPRRGGHWSLERVRAARAELLERWAAIQPGQELVLRFRCRVASE